MRRFIACLLLVALLCPAVTAFTPRAAEGPPVSISSESAVLMEASQGRILFAKGEHAVLPPASVTKLMLMLLVMEAVDSGRMKLSEIVTASPEACKMGGSQIWLEQGEQMTVADLMKAISIVSANDASVALAEHMAGSEENFVRLMNKRAQELGLKDTVYVNCTGLTPDAPGAKGNVTSAHDQAVLAQAMLRHPGVLKWTGTWIDYLRNGQSFLRNTNNLVRFYDGCDGLKTGFTEQAGFCLVATAKRAGVRLIAAIMKAPTSQIRNAEISKLFNYGFSQLKAYQFYKGGEVVANLPVTLGKRNQVPVVVERELAAVVDRTVTASPKTAITLPAKVTAPIKQGMVLGRVVVTIEGKECGRTNLIAASSVPRSGFFSALGKVLAETIKSLFKRG
ncbi:MAG: D-alanyl-D-alanine carboxypeptidase family protein [Bacteroidota bacterium]